MTEAQTNETKPAPTAAAEDDALAIANKIAMVEASPKEILDLKPNKAADATTGSDADEAAKASAKTESKKAD